MTSYVLTKQTLHGGNICVRSNCLGIFNNTPNGVGTPSLGKHKPSIILTVG